MKKILIIEDNSDVLANLTEFLNLEGYEVVVAYGGEMGISLAGMLCPDLIICDVMMPGTDGYQVLKTMKESGKTNQIPFIFCTALPANTAMAKAMVRGADDFITKPVDMDELLIKVKTLLGPKSHRNFARD